nr:PorP/SprF family type IX secretion system membrane protein [Bacteroidota bacterium]
MKLIKTFFTIGCALIYATAFAQDNLPSHYLANPLFLNPAYTGGSEGITTSLNHLNNFGRYHRNHTTFLSTDIPIEKVKGGFGILLSLDANYLLLKRTAGLSYAYGFRINENLSLRAGAVLDYLNYKMDDEQFNQTYYPYSTIDKQQSIDISGGFLLSGKQFSIGSAIHHINEPDMGMIRNPASSIPYENLLQRRLIINGTYTFSTPRLKISPHFLFSAQGAAQNLMLGVYVDRGPFYLGGNISHTNIREWGDAISVLIGGRYKGFNLGYSYGITVSTLHLRNAYASHEIFLRKSFAPKKDRKQSVVH